MGMPSNESMREYDEELRQRRARRRERERIRRRRHYRNLAVRAGACLVVLVVAATGWFISRRSEGDAETPEELAVKDVPLIPAPPEKEAPLFTVTTTEKTQTIGAELPSAYAVVVDRETGESLAEKGSEERINPASMVKMMTLLVASEEIPDRSGTFTMTREITDYCYQNDCSVVGYLVDEVIPVEELFYGCILSSGADACLALAELASGSQEAFVERMNEKARQLGIGETSHFTNCVGVYDENLYSTTRDLAVILRAALEDPWCEKVLTARKMTTAATAHHPEGQVLSNWFLRRIEDKDTGALTVRGAKTGYVKEAGSCAASYGETAEGRGFLCVTAKAHSAWRAIYDHVALYNTYCQPQSEAAEQKNHPGA